MRVQEFPTPPSRTSRILICFLLMAASPCLQAKNTRHTWTIGKILDGNQAQYYANLLSKLSQPANGGVQEASFNRGNVEPALVAAVAVTAHPAAGTLMVEGMGFIYVTSEPIQWRWSKDAHIPVSGAIEFYTEGARVHVMDDVGKEHALEVIRVIKKVAPVTQMAIASAPARPPALASTPVPAAQPAAASPNVEPRVVSSIAAVNPAGAGASESIRAISKAFATAAVAVAAPHGNGSTSAAADTPAAQPARCWRARLIRRSLSRS